MNKSIENEMNVYLVFFVVFVVVFYGYYLYTRFSNRMIEIDQSMLKASTSGQRSSNLISAKDGTLYKVMDAWMLLHFKSAEVLNVLTNKSAETFWVSGYGTRVPALGLYPVITSAIPQNTY